MYIIQHCFICCPSDSTVSDRSQSPNLETFKDPGIDSKESIPPADVAWRNQFLGSLKFKIRAQDCCGIGIDSQTL